MMAGQALSFAPDYISAKVSAARLFKLLDRKSDIDVNDNKGEEVVMFSFSNLNYSQTTHIASTILDIKSVHFYNFNGISYHKQN